MRKQVESFSNMPRTTQLVTNWWSLELNLEECGPKIYATTTSHGWPVKKPAFFL